jgi:hypothetical protein
MKNLKITIVLIVLFAIISCSSDEDKILGGWKATNIELNGNSSLGEGMFEWESLGLTFHENGNLDIQMPNEQVKGAWELNIKKRGLKLWVFPESKFKIEGTYKIKGSYLTIRGNMFLDDSKMYSLLEMKRN